jgi:8-oxo-dGTP pyrophosphatase MutT (NUDIX family)
MPTTTRSTDARSTHAGGVVYRLKDTTPELLLVTARMDRSVWVLPKGHIEHGESPDQTAVREIFEEAGVTARIVEFLTSSRQLIRGVPQQIEYYLLEHMAEEKASEGRRIAWLAQDAVIRRITYEEQRAVLVQACARLAQTRGAL